MNLLEVLEDLPSGLAGSIPAGRLRRGGVAALGKANGPCQGAGIKRSVAGAKCGNLARAFNNMARAAWTATRQHTGMAVTGTTPVESDNPCKPVQFRPRATGK